MTTHKEALEAAYLAGFNASGEGYNGEYPFGDKMQDPAENPVWKKDRDNYIKEALMSVSDGAQPEQCTYPNCDYPCMNLPDCKQRTWVGLTDKEKSNLWLESRAAIPRFYTYASLVEANLKEKNTRNGGCL